MLRFGTQWAMRLVTGLGSRSSRTRVRPRYEYFLFWLVSAASVSIGLLTVWRWRFLPSLGYPAWLYEGHVLGAWLTGQAPPGYTVSPYPVPNSTRIAVLALLKLILGTDI